MRALLPLLLIALAAPVAAQQQVASAASTQAVGVDVQIGVIRQLSVLPGSGEESIEAGYAEHDDAMTLRVTANVAWRIEVAVGSGSPLEVRPDGTNTYAPVGAGWQPIASGGRGSNQEIVLDLRRAGTDAPDAQDLQVRLVTR